MKKQWENVYKRGYKLIKPNKWVVSLVTLLKKNKARRILDLGCGRGGHLLFLAKKGFFVVGSDFSSLALRQAQQLMESNHINNYSLVEHDMTKFPFPDNHYDCVISTFTIHHNSIKKIRETIKEVNRVLKKDGLVLISFPTKKDFKYGQGRMIEKDTYITLIEEADSFDGKNIVHHFFDEKSAKRAFSQFKIIKIEEEITTRERAKTIAAHIYVLAQKR